MALSRHPPTQHAFQSLRSAPKGGPMVVAHESRGSTRSADLGVPDVATPPLVEPMISPGVEVTGPR
jgi:hypothetical protein